MPNRDPDASTEFPSAGLLRSSQDGDAAALEALLVRHLPTLRVFVRGHMDARMRARESSSDLVQSICRQVLAAPGRFEFRGESDFRNWLYTAVLNKVRERFRRRHAQKRDGGEARLEDWDQLEAGYRTTSDPPGQAIRREDLERLEEAIASLPEDQRDVLMLSKIVGLPHAEIAARTGRSEQACRAMLLRAKAAVAARLVLEEDGDASA